MLDMSTLTIAAAAKLSADAGLAALSPALTQTRGERINYDPAVCPWLGIYPGTVDTVPRAMGSRQWKDDAGIQIVVQTASFSDDGQAASDQLEDIVGKVLDAINADLTLGVVGVRVVSFAREYRYVIFDDDGAGSIFMPQAIIKVKMEVRSN